MAQTDPLCYSDEYESSNTCLHYITNTNSKEESSNSCSSTDSNETKNVNIEKIKLIKSFLDAFEPNYLHRHEFLNESLDLLDWTASKETARTAQSISISSNNTNDKDSFNLDGYSNYKDSMWKNKSVDEIHSFKFKPYVPNMNILGRIREAYNNCTCKVCECITEKTSEKNLNNACDCYSCQEQKGYANFQYITNGVHDYKDLCSPNKYTSTTNNCDCNACRKWANYQECSYKRPGDKLQTLTVATASDNVEGNLCDCSPCSCYGCVGHGHGTEARMTHNVATGMSTTNQERCSCNLCASEVCPRSTDACTCTGHGVIISKPIDTKAADYDIHRMSLFFINPFLSTFSVRNDTIAMVSAVNNNLQQGLNKNISHCRTCECVLCKPILGKGAVPSRKPSSFEPLAKVIRKVHKLNSECKCSPCECLQCKNTLSLNVDSSCEICKRQKKKKSEFVPTTSSDAQNFENDTCSCQKCDCVFCEKLVRCYTNLENKSNESIYPVKKGKLLTPSMLNICYKIKNQMPCKENTNEKEKFVSQGHLTKCLDKIDSSNVCSQTCMYLKKNVLSKKIENDLDHNIRRKLDNPIMELDAIKNINKTKMDGGDFKCLHKCGICNNITVLTLNDFEIKRYTKDNNSSTIFDQPVADINSSEIDCILNRSRLLTFQFNEVISELEKNKNTANEDNQLTSSNTNSTNNHKFNSNSNKKLLNNIFNEDYNLNNLFKNAVKVKSKRTDIPGELDIDIRNGCEGTTIGSDGAKQITKVACIKSNISLTKEKNVCLTTPVTHMPIDLFNNEHYLRYKDLVKEVAVIMETIKEMKNILNKRDCSKQAPTNHNQVQNTSVHPAFPKQGDLITTDIIPKKESPEQNVAKKAILEQMECGLNNILNLPPKLSNNNEESFHSK